MAAALLFVAAPATAQSPDDTARAKAHYVKGKELLAKGQLKDAVREFKRAYLAKRVPAILFNIGQIYRKLGDNASAVHFFEKFVAEAPATDKNRKAAQEIIVELKAGGARPPEAPQAPAEPPARPRIIRGRGPAATPAPRRPRRSSVEAFTHDTIDEVPPDKPMDVTCQVPDVEGVRVTLFYRVSGQESFTPVIMKPRLGEHVGRIPAREMSGRAIQYYVEARDAKAKLMGNSGTAANPNIVLISSTAKPHYYADMGDEGTGADFIPAPRRKKEKDRPPRDLRIWKWSAATVAVALLGASIGAYLYSGMQADTLTDKAAARDGDLPHNSFYKDLRDMESSGKLNSTLGTVSLVSAIVVGAGAGLLFYYDDAGLFEAPPQPEGKDSRRRRRRASTSLRANVVPVLGPDTVGLTGQVRF